MDQSNNSKVDKHFIYGIFRACRLCGAGAGYKMPIIQNVIDVDGEEVELKQKIRECVHIEVRQDDKMPPLICELCVDKVNDFYEFLEMCRQTNKRTRKILGLPMPSKKGAVTSDDCILGVTEPVYVNEDSNEPLSKSSPRNAKQKPMPAKFKKVEIKLTQMENISKQLKNAKLPPKRQRSPSPPPRTGSAKPHSKRRSPSPPPRTGSAKPHSKRQRSPSPPPRNSSAKQALRRQRSPSPPPKNSSVKQALRRQKSLSPPHRTSSAKPSSRRQKSPSPPPRNSSAKPSLRRQRSPSPPPKTSSAKQPPKRQRSPSPPPRTSSAKQHLKRQRSPTPPPRITRNSRGSNEDNQSLSSLKSKRTTRQSSPATPPPKSILKKEPKIEEKPSPKPKRAPEPPKPAVPLKKVKLSVQPAPAPKSPPLTKCSICKYLTKTPQATANHLRTHTATYTSEKLACNACREWFTNVDEAIAHHNRRHKARNRAYLCRGCDERYDTYHSYQAHASHHKCVPWEEVPDVKCSECWKNFPTNNLRDSHKCQGVEARPGGKCAKCNRPYALQKNLKKHESTCTAKRRSDYIDPALLSKVRPIQVRVARCDALLQRVSNGHYDVSDVQDYGLDPTRVYPYIYSASLNFNRMVNIKSDLDFYCDEDYIHWDSEISDDEDERFLEREKKVPSLTTIALKTLFSQKLLGRVPRKKRKMKSEKSLFDVIMSTDFDIDMTRDINNIIDNLSDDDDDDSAVNYGEKASKNEYELGKSVEKDINEDNTSDTDLSQDKEDSSGATEHKESVNEKNYKVDCEDTEKSSVNPEIEPKIANDVEDSNKSGKSGETSKTDEKTTDMKENTGESVRESEKKESTDSNKIDTEQVNDASELSANTDSVSESLESKKADTNLSENLNQAEVDIRNKDINENNDNIETDSAKVKDEISKDDKNEQNNTNLDLVDTDKEKSNTENHNEGTTKTNSNDDSQNKEDKIETNDDNVQQINSQLNEIEKSETNFHKTDNTNDANMHKENNKTEASTEHKTPIDANDTDKNINGVDEKSDKLNMEDFNDVCDAEIDDAKLMKDLNEHIGETDEKTSEPTDSSDAEGSKDKNDKDTITLEGLAAKKDSDARSMDLDSISDEEFNFDN